MAFWSKDPDSQHAEEKTPAQDSEDASVAVAFLNKAKSSLKIGHYIEAIKNARAATEAAYNAEELHDKVIRGITRTEYDLGQAKRRRLDTTEAEETLDLAKKAAEELEYRKALTLIKQSRYKMHRALFSPFPLLTKNVTIKSNIGWDQGQIRYRVRLENHSRESIGEICLVPSVPEEVFGKVAEKIIEGLGPYEAAEVVYNLIPQKDEWLLGVPGELLQGKDVTVRTILECREGEAIYKVKIRNNKGNRITDLIVRPFIPSGLIADENEKVVPVLHPFSAVSVVFPLRPEMAPEEEVIFETEEPVEDEVTFEEEEDDYAPEWEEDEEDEEPEEEEFEEDEEEDEPEVDWTQEEAELAGFTPVDEGSRFMAYMPDTASPPYRRRREARR